MAKTALITGITGQDGSYLPIPAGKRLQRSWHRSALKQRAIQSHRHIAPRLRCTADLLDQFSLVTASNVPNARSLQPGAQSSCRPVGATLLTGRVYRGGRHPQLEAVVPSDETTSVYRRRPAKCSAGSAKLRKRKPRVLPAQSTASLGSMDISSPSTIGESYRHVRDQRHPVQPRIATPRFGICHSQDHRCRREDQTRKQKTLPRNLNRATRLGICRDYVQAMWLMLQREEADDY